VVDSGSHPMTIGRDGSQRQSRNGLSGSGIYHPCMARSLHTPEYDYFRFLLAEERAKKGLTQAEVSSRLGLPQSFVAKYEGGERRLDVVEFVRVCGALGVDPHTMLSRVEERVRQ